MEPSDALKYIQFAAETQSECGETVDKNQEWWFRSCVLDQDEGCLGILFNRFKEGNDTGKPSEIKKFLISLHEIKPTLKEWNHDK